MSARLAPSAMNINKLRMRFSFLFLLFWWFVFGVGAGLLIGARFSSIVMRIFSQR